MWHTFLLYSRDYEVFSKRYFGRFVYHVPITDRQLRLQSRRTTRSHDRRQLTNDIAIVVSELGYPVARRWYRNYLTLPERVGSNRA